MLASEAWITLDKNIQNNRTPFPDQFPAPICSFGSSSLQPKSKHQCR